MISFATRNKTPLPTSQLPAPLLRLHRYLTRLGGRLSRLRAQHLQRRFCKCHIAVTGSCGKTTATKLINDLLLATGATVAAGVHMNNGRYLWRTMSKLRGATDFVVQEVGAGWPGAIAELTDHFTVDVAVVTTVGYDHGSAYDVPYSDVLDAIALEKGKLVEAVGPSGLVCLNADDLRVAAMAARTGARVVTFGRAESADLRAVDVGARWPERLHFNLLIGGRSYPVRTRFVGTIMLPSVLAALAVVHGSGRDLQKAVEALATAEPARRHMSVVEGESSGRAYVVDIEKAPLWSTQLLVDDVDAIGGKGMLFVLGEMSDMRSGKTRHYTKLARQLASRVDRVILTGQAAAAEPRLSLEGVANVFAAPSANEVAELVATGTERLVVLKCKAGSDLAQVIPLVEARSLRPTPPPPARTLR